MIARGKVRADGSPEELTRHAASNAAMLVEARPREGASIETLVDAARGTGGPGMVVAEALPDGWARLRIEPEPGAGDLRARVAADLHRAGASVRELRAENASLEEVFSRAIAQADEEASS